MSDPADNGQSSTQDQKKEETIVKLAVQTTLLLRNILQRSGILESEYEISGPRVRQLSERLYRDLERIREAQDDSICITKVAGYWAFWIRKIRPIVAAYHVVDGEERELPEINERLALEFAVSYIRARGKNYKGHKAYDPFRANCPQAACDGMACVTSYAKDGLSGVSNVLAEYAVHCMRYRTFGPHHFVIFLDQLLISACFAYRQRSPRE